MSIFHHLFMDKRKLLGAVALLVTVTAVRTLNAKATGNLYKLLVGPYAELMQPPHTQLPSTPILRVPAIPSWRNLVWPRKGCRKD